MEREIRKEREERERRREDDGLFDRREKETSKYNYLVVKERERERREEQRQSVFSPCYYVRGIITTYSVKKRG